MTGVQTIRADWWHSLRDLVSSAKTQLTIVSPFINLDGCRLIVDFLHPRLKAEGQVHVLTDLSPRHVRDGALQPEAVFCILDSAENGCLWHVPCLHAKVYLADHQRAIVTSGNLTRSAFFRNVEIGLEISDCELLSSIESELTELRLIGTPVGQAQLKTYSDVAKHVRLAFQRQQSAVDPKLQLAFSEAVRSAEDELIRFRLAGGAMHTIFARTVLHVLHKYGPLPTVEVHRIVQTMHPDLCDDTIDRVIDGKRFGKKWKHAIRTAEQHLKRRGLVEFDGKQWRATP